ncbi:MAG TPA: hypothetical protein P5165_07950 [Spirochaetia bacterium]|nr:hypothetical protein [Spirochaetales bacterium]HRY73141.1 hypothetical protein [Spirochaetia bacterium]
MPESGLDPRIKRTRGLIVTAYLEARAKGEARASSVAGVCALAGISRSVFYRHFEGLADLEARGLGLFLSGLLEESGLEAASGGQGRRLGVGDRVARFFAALERHRPTILPLLKRSPPLGEALRGVAEEWLGEHRLGRIPDEALRLPRRYAAPLLASSLLAFCAAWLEDPRGEGPEEAASAFLEFATKGLFDFGS